MITTTTKTKPSLTEFVILISLLMSLTALSIDAMLPALAQIGTDLDIPTANDRQLIISSIFLGLSIGQLFFGPLSDKTGRKPAIFAGLVLFMGGALMSMFAVSFLMMLTGRLVQGIGISAPRAVTLALVRDQYEGREMARVMSFVMTVFILVPIIAPSMGQGILLFAGWRTIFGSFILLALVALAWLGVRQPETLPARYARALHATAHRAHNLGSNQIPHRIRLHTDGGAGQWGVYRLFKSSQQIFQELYDLGDRFPLFFGLLAGAIGLASLLNSRLVMRFGMRRLVRGALLTITVLAAGTLIALLPLAGRPPLWALFVYLTVTLFCVGILFGNLNSLAMEPLGHIAGIGAAIVGSLSTLISTLLGTYIGQSYNETIFPLVLGLGILAALSIFVVIWAEREPVKA